jgi:hypothetical protein
VYNALRELGNTVFPILKTWISNGADAAAAAVGSAAHV